MTPESARLLHLGTPHRLMRIVSGLLGKEHLFPANGQPAGSGDAVLPMMQQMDAEVVGAF